MRAQSSTRIIHVLVNCRQLQLNLIRSHAVGYGQPLSPPRARMLLALRSVTSRLPQSCLAVPIFSFSINILAKGHSGISLANMKKMIAAFNCEHRTSTRLRYSP